MNSNKSLRERMGGSCPDCHGFKKCPRHQGGIEPELREAIARGDKVMLDRAVKALDELQDMLRDAAKADCTGCDGTGIFMGNVCICACVSAANLDKKAKPNGR